MRLRSCWLQMEGCTCARGGQSRDGAAQSKLSHACACVRALSLLRYAAMSKVDPSLPSRAELFIADYLGIRTQAVARESRAWSHTSYTDQSLILQITAQIEEQGGKDAASSDLIAARRDLFHALIRHDCGAYVRAATAVGGLIDRNDLPNVQLVPHPSRSLADLSPQPVDRVLVGGKGEAAAADELVPDCTLANATFADNALDKVLLFLFRSLVQRETGYTSSKDGILGLLEVCARAKVAAPCGQPCRVVHIVQVEHVSCGAGCGCRSCC